MENFVLDKTFKLDVSKMGLSSSTLDLLSKANGLVKLDNLGDVASLTRTELMSIFVDLGVNYEKISDAVEEIEQALSTKGISLGDARAQIVRDQKSVEEIEKAKGILISSLGLENSFVVNVMRHGIETLGDCSKFYSSEIRDWLSNHQKTQLKELEQVLSQNGLSFKQKESFLDLKDPDIPYVNVEELEDEDAEYFYSRPVSALGISQLAVERLKKHGINTIGELSNLYVNQLRVALDGHDKACALIKKRLSQYNIDIEYYNEDYFEEQKIPTRYIGILDDDKKDKLLARPLTDIGVTPRFMKLLEKRGIVTIGDFEELSPKELRKSLINVNKKAVHELFDRLAKFGIDKREIIYDRRYQESTKEKVDLETLSEEDRKQYLSSPIDGMGFSISILEKFKSIGVQTVEDLTKLSLKDIRKLVNNSPSAQKRIREILEDYGIEPVKLSTRFIEPKVEAFKFSEAESKKQQEFLARPIEDLGITGVFSEKLKSKDINTIGQLLNLTIKNLKVDLETSDYIVFKLKNRLAQYGIVLNYDELEQEREQIEFADIPSMSIDEKKEFLSKPIEDFKLDKFTLKKIKSSGITTLGELLDIEKSELRKKLNANNVMMNEIELLIGNLGERMKGSLCFVVDGKLVYKSQDINNIKTQRKVDLVDIRTLSPQDRDKMLDTKLEDLGLHVRAIDLIHKKSDIKTLRDIQSIHLGELNYLLAYNNEYIEETLSVLSKFGIKIERVEKKTTKGRTFKKTSPNLDKSETKEDILALSLTDIGISHKIAQRLKNDLGIKTVEDLTQTSKNRLNYIGDGKYYISSVCEKALQQVGLSLKEVEKKSSKPEQILEPVNIAEMEEEDLVKFGKQKIELFGLSKKTTKILMNEYGIKTIGEFLALSPLQVYDFLYNNDHLYTKTCERMMEFGLEMPSYKELKRAEKKGITKDNEGNDFKRKMIHYHKYLQYIKMRQEREKQELSDNDDQDSSGKF